MRRCAVILISLAVLASGVAAGQSADQSRKAAYIHAFGALQTIFIAEQTYKQDHSDEGFSKDLKTLADLGWLDAEYACGTPSCEVKGYKFRYQRQGQDRFQVTATPTVAQREDADWGKFPPAMMIDDSGMIRPPDMEWPPKEPSQDGAINSLRTYNTAEITYASAYPEIGYSADLGALGPGPEEGSEPTAQHAGLIISALGCPGSVCDNNGYRFTYAKISKERYTLTARPLKFGEGGTLSFYTDETAVIRSTIEDREPTANDEAVIFK